MDIIARANFLNDLGFNPDVAGKLDHAGAGDIQIKKRGVDTEILLYEQIGFDWQTSEGVTAKQFDEALKGAGSGKIVVRINSPGGDVWDGIAIYNMLKSTPNHVETVVEGVAASAASIVAMAGDSVRIYPSAQLMIHSAWTIAMGNSSEFRDVADVLEKIDLQLAEIYSAKSGKGPDEFLSIMNKDNYYTAKESIELGLVDSVVDLESDKEKLPAAASDNKRITADARRRMLSLRKARLGL